MQNSKRKNKGNQYHVEVKKFALTLHFYSPKAFSCLRKIFNLPRPSSIRNYTSTINCEHRFHTGVLHNLSKQLESNPEMADCVLMIDAMAIRKQVLYDTKNAKYSGFVDYGGVVGEASEDQASEALVFLLVGLKKYWKCPIGYLLTCDGTFANLETFRILGCKFIPNFEKMKSYFPHPCCFSCLSYV